jgi:hypothetical protein
LFKDRDNYVQVNWGNILPGQEHNFNKYSSAQAITLGFYYDFTSIMHYEWDAFSKSMNFYYYFKIIYIYYKKQKIFRWSSNYNSKE